MREKTFVTNYIDNNLLATLSHKKLDYVMFVCLRSKMPILNPLMKKFFRSSFTGICQSKWCASILIFITIYTNILEFFTQKQQRFLMNSSVFDFLTMHALDYNLISLYLMEKTPSNDVETRMHIILASHRGQTSIWLAYTCKIRIKKKVELIVIAISIYTLLSHEIDSQNSLKWVIFLKKYLYNYSNDNTSNNSRIRSKTMIILIGLWAAKYLSPAFDLSVQRKMKLEKNYVTINLARRGYTKMIKHMLNHRNITDETKKSISQIKSITNLASLWSFYACTFEISSGNTSQGILTLLQFNKFRCFPAISNLFQNLNSITNMFDIFSKILIIDKNFCKNKSIFSVYRRSY
jgi:hypothetical protein